MHACCCFAVAAASAPPAGRAPHKRPAAATSNAEETPTARAVDAAAAHNAASPPPAAVLSRRHAAAATLLAAAAWAAPHVPAAAAAAAAAAAFDEGSKASFYAEWPYVSPSDILPFLRAAATPGDADSVLAAIDRFAEFYPMYRCGPEKGAILEELVAAQQPALALELGTFMGYGAARIARQLPPGGRLISIEASEEQAAVARQVLEYAGIPVGEGPEARVRVVAGLSGDVLPRLRQLAGLGSGAAAGFVFLDHCKPCYLPDLVTMEQLGLVAPGTLVLADNVLVPGAPDYLQHVGGSTLGGSSSFFAGSESSSSADGGGRGTPSRGGGDGTSSGGDSSGTDGGLAYRTELRYTAFEVEERYKKDWQPRRDAMSVSRCL
ncbi:hypothetical protein ABPG75_011187 [Micractinium tetrahymenae]